jgi:hypothetical protein
MIKAKDIFILEREMIAETVRRLAESNLSPEEQEEIFHRMEGDLTEQEYFDIQRVLTDRQTSPLTRVKNGETLNQSQINQAVRQAVKHG